MGNIDDDYPHRVLVYIYMYKYIEIFFDNKEIIFLLSKDLALFFN